jgi:hypothetical protein
MTYQIVTILLAFALVGVLIWTLRLRSANTLLQAEVRELANQLEQAIQQLAQYEAESKSKTFTKMVDLLAAAGIPGLILLAAMAISGFTGAAAITVALSSLGGPAGMLGGIGVLVALGVVIAKYGVTDVSLAVVRKLLKTRSKAALIKEIESLPRVVPDKFRNKAKAMLEVG